MAKPDPYGTDAEFGAYMRLEYLKMAGVAIGLVCVVALWIWLP